MKMSRSTTSSRSPRRFRIIRPLLASVVLVVLAGLGFKGWRLYSLAQALQADLHALQAQASQVLDNGDLAALGPLLAQTRQHAVALRDEAAPLFPLTSRLGWLPGYGPNLAAAAPLLDSASDLASAADTTYAALASQRNSGPPLAALAAQLRDAQPQLAQARQQLAQASARLASVDAESLSPRLGQPIQQLRPLLPAARDALDLALAAPHLLGADGPQSYLLLAQNPDELRATGGFISGAGVLTIAQGRVAGFSLDDSAGIDDLSAGPYPPAPEPIRRYMGDRYNAPLLWVFRDANWSPDFPTSARAALDLYRRGQARQVDHVIAFDPAAVQLLLEALGPVSVVGAAAPVTAENAQQHLRDSWSAARQQGQESQQKAFLGQLGAAIISRVEQEPRSHMPALARAIGRALDQRHLLIFVDDPDAAAVLAQRGWDGAVKPGDGDFLMVVASNMGYDKVNPNIRQAITYTVDLSDPAAPLAAASIRHSHMLPGAAECDQWQKYGGQAARRYEDRMDDCYWNYLRVLAPGQSQLAGFDTQPTPDSWMLSGVGEPGTLYVEPGESGSTTFGTFLVVPRGGQRTTGLRYRLPPAVLTRDLQGWHYHLKLQNQPGQAQQVSVQLLLPASATVVATSIEPSRRTERVLTFDIDLRGDRTLDVAFRTLE